MRDGSPRLLREINDRAAIETLLRGGPLTRAELERTIGLSKPATAQLLTRLEESNIALRNGFNGGRRGPRAQLWSVNGALAYVAGVDVRAGRADIAIADIAGDLHAEFQAKMPRGRGADVLSALGDAMRQAVGLAGLDVEDLNQVVVGCPGALDRHSGHLQFAPHMPEWEGFDLLGSLTELFDVPVKVENDLHLVALEEMIAGKATDVRNFVLIWPAEEIGSAVVVNRMLLRGATGGAGEIDRMLVPSRAGLVDEPERAGHRFVDLLNRAAVAALAKEHGITARGGPAAVRAALRMGDAGVGFLTEMADRIAVAVANVVCVVDPDLVLLAGNIAEAGGERLCGLVAEELHRLAIPRTPVELARVTGNSVRAGALHAAHAIVREEIFGIPAADFMKRAFFDQP